MAGAIPGLTDVGSVSPLPPNPNGNKDYSPLPAGQAAANAKAAGATSTVTANSAQQTLGKTAFLQLLVQEMTNQDPLKPADDTQFIAQLAQFSSLEQMQNMNTTLGSLVTNNQMAQATAMLGQEVMAVNSATGAQVNGIADKVILTSGTDSSGAATTTVQVDVSGTPVNIGDIISVGPGASALQPTQPVQGPPVQPLTSGRSTSLPGSLVPAPASSGASGSSAA